MIIGENTLKEIANIFIGDSTDFFQYKSGPMIYEFFNDYFGSSDSYWDESQKSSRWKMVLDRLLKIQKDNQINQFFSIITSSKYLYTENRNYSVIELTELSKKIIESLNAILKIDNFRLLIAREKMHLVSINNDLELIGTGGFAKVYKVKSANIIFKKTKRRFVVG